MEFKSGSQYGASVRSTDRALNHEPTPGGCSGASLCTDDLEPGENVGQDLLSILDSAYLQSDSEVTFMHLNTGSENKVGFLWGAIAFVLIGERSCGRDRVLMIQS